MDTGQVMGEGVRELSRRIGQGSERFAMHVKGMEYPAYEPRGAFGAALSYAVSPRGACHRRAWPLLGDPWSISPVYG